MPFELPQNQLSQTNIESSQNQQSLPLELPPQTVNLTRPPSGFNLPTGLSQNIDPISIAPLNNSFGLNPLPLPQHNGTNSNIEQKSTEVSIHTDTQEIPELNVIRSTVPQLYFIADEKYPGLAIKEDGDNLICIGRLEIGIPITKETVLPETWYSAEYLKEINENERSYLNETKIGYRYLSTAPQNA